MPITFTESIKQDLGSAQVADTDPGIAGTPVQEPVVTPPVAEIAPETTPEQVIPATETTGAASSAETTQPAPAAEAPAQPTFEQLFEEKSGGRFKSIDDVVRLAEELEQLRNQPKPTDDLFADEQIKLINGFVKLGKGTFAEGLNALTKDFNQMDKFDVLRAYSELKEPYLTPEQRDFAIQELKDKLDPELHDPKAILSAQIAFEREVNQKRGELIQGQQTTVESLRNEIAAMQPQAAAAPEVSQAEIEAATQKWRSAADQSLAAVKELSHQIKDANGNVIGEYKFAVDDAAQGRARNDAYLADNFTQRYATQNSDGTISWDRDRFFNDMLWLNNREAIINSYVTQAQSNAAKNLIGQVANAPAPNPQTPPAAAGGGSKDPIMQARQQMLGGR